MAVGHYGVLHPSVKNIAAQFSGVVTVNLICVPVRFRIRKKAGFFYDAVDIAVALTSMRGTGMHS